MELRRAGERRHLVTLEHLTGRLPVGDGYEEIWEPYGQAWASVQPVVGGQIERAVANTQQAPVTHVIRLDYQDDLKAEDRLRLQPSGAGFPRPPIRDGASHYWNLDETTGPPIARDPLGGMTGLVTGGVTRGQPGITGSAMAFNGTTGRIVTAQHVSVLPPFSWEIWIRTTLPMAANRALCGLSFPNPDVGADAFGILMHADGSAVQWQIMYASGLPTTGHAFSPASGALLDDVWHQIVVVYPGGLNLLAYLDGQPRPVAPPTLRMPLVGSTIRKVEIGYSGVFGAWWPGSIDEVAIYPYALTSAQVANHYAWARAPEGRKFYIRGAANEDERDWTWVLNCEERMR